MASSTRKEVEHNVMGISDIEHIQDVDKTIDDSRPVTNNISSFVNTASNAIPTTDALDMIISESTFESEASIQVIDLKVDKQDVLVLIPGIDEDTSDTIVKQRQNCDMLEDFVQSEVACDIILDDIQYDVGGLACGEISLKFGETKIDQNMLEQVQDTRLAI